MITNNPFAALSDIVPTIAMQGFLIVMVILVILGTLIDIIHKKNVKYFFENAKKAKKSATRVLGTGEKTSIIVKAVVYDIGTTSELGAGKRRVAHLLGMYGTILFWIASAVMIFCYSSSSSSSTPSLWPIIWHTGAIMTVLGGSWFWFFLRVDVYSEAQPWYRIIKADLFVLALIATSLFGLIWSYLQFLNLNDRWDDKVFLVLYVIANLILFGGVYWSKFAHMFYKPGAAIQKNLAEADGSRDNLPPEADAPEKFGLGIKREAPKHY
jgi:hypothetical protein